MEGSQEGTWKERTNELGRKEGTNLEGRKEGRNLEGLGLELEVFEGVFFCFWLLLVCRSSALIIAVSKTSFMIWVLLMDEA